MELGRSVPALPGPGDGKSIHSFIQPGFIVVCIWLSSKQSQLGAGKGPEAPAVERSLPGRPGQKTGVANTTPSFGMLQTEAHISVLPSSYHTLGTVPLPGCVSSFVKVGDKYGSRVT